MLNILSDHLHSKLAMDHRRQVVCITLYVTVRSCTFMLTRTHALKDSQGCVGGHTCSVLKIVTVSEYQDTVSVQHCLA